MLDLETFLIASNSKLPTVIKVIAVVGYPVTIVGNGLMLTECVLRTARSF